MDAKKLVLVVDDNQVNRRILCKILEDEYTIIEAENGQQAKDILADRSFEISAILLDLFMPVMNGIQFLEMHKQNPIYATIPVIVTTMDDGKEQELKVLRLGAKDFFPKPYNPLIIKHRLANTIKLRESAAIINTMERDSLTGVYSKEFFYEKAKKIILLGKRNQYDLICIDIDNFKLINDLFGTEEGDRLLIYLAHLINLKYHHCKIVGRIGADTFVTLVPHYEHHNRKFFEDWVVEFNEYPLNINLNIRFGIYKVHDRHVPINVMCDRAKLAIESIKGKYKVYHAYYNDSIRTKLIEEQEIADGMKVALQEEQFKVFYQPKYELRTEKIVGAEALVRWFHPEKGIIPPDKFIPLFERNGFITELDAYVWEQACKDIRENIDKGFAAMPISVNISRVDIYNPRLIEIVLGLVHKYNLSTDLLHLEITETAYTQNPQQLIDVVTQLKKHGFTIEMDDFGTGYSSLNMLSELPIDMLKLDMRFLQNKSKKQTSVNIISFIVSLAKWLGLPVVAEGVETREQITMLRNMDCTYVQGYYYAKPLPKKEFDELLLQSEVVQMKEKRSFFEQISTSPNIEPEVELAMQSEKEVMLIVDDLESNRVILKEIFKSEYHILEAENGVKALELLLSSKGKIQVVLLDLLMPVMDGFQMLQQMAGHGLLEEIPVIVTSQAGDGSEEVALELGAADFILKPYRNQVVRSRVHNVMENMQLKRQLKNIVIAEKSHTNNEYKKQEERLDHLMHVINGGIAIYKYNQKNGIYETVYCNESLCELVGCDKEEYRDIIKKDKRNIIYKEDQIRVQKCIQEAEEGNTPIDIRYRIQHKNGELVWIHLTGIKIKDEDNNSYYHCVFMGES